MGALIRAMMMVGAVVAAAVCVAAGATCPADGTGSSHLNSVYNVTTGSGVPTAGPKLPAITPRPMRTHGAVGSCVGNATQGFDGGEIIVAATIPLRGPAAAESYSGCSEK